MAADGRTDSRLRGSSVFFAALGIALAIAFSCSGAARAQSFSDTSYITPFPENDTYRLEVWGDLLAEGLLPGLVDQLADEPRVSVQRRHRPIPSLMRATVEEDISELVSEIARSNTNIIVVLTGLNDRIPLRLPNGRRAPVGSDLWREEYGRRVDRIMRAFKAQRIAVYWVSLPIMRRPDVNEESQAINEIVRERASVATLKTIDVYQATADESGNYNPYGPDLTGTQRLLRQGDGITFTAAGYRKLAHFVERELKRDLVQARAQRSIPLAGGEAEQRLIRPIRNAAPAQSARSATAAGTKQAPGGAARPSTATTDGELKADNGRVTLPEAADVGAIDLPRPAIPGSLMALLARRTANDRTGQPGEVLVREIPGGLTLSRTISTAASPGAPQRRALPSQTPFFRVLVKGERLEPKAGRADDIGWPAAAAPTVGQTTSPAIAPAAAPMPKAGIR